jgi:hypothetical protein
LQLVIPVPPPFPSEDPPFAESEFEPPELQAVTAVAKAIVKPIARAFGAPGIAFHLETRIDDIHSSFGSSRNSRVLRRSVEEVSAPGLSASPFN